MFVFRPEWPIQNESTVSLHTKIEQPVHHELLGDAVPEGVPAAPAQWRRLREAVPARREGLRPSVSRRSEGERQDGAGRHGDQC